MGSHALVDQFLRYPRLARTLAAVRSYQRRPGMPGFTQGQAQYNMRSAMDLHPKAGKWISQRAIRTTDPMAWQIADVRGSRFIPAEEIEQAVYGIKQNGFYVFGRTVDPSITDAIRSFAEQAPSTGRGLDATASPYPRQDPQAGRYDISETTALACPEVQEFATDPAMAMIAQRYLGQPVLMDEVAFWWTTTRRAEDANLNAQLFHQDRDRLSFLKFFIYLTDVTPDSGPHVYLRGSHADVPGSLRGDGRKADEDVRAAGLWDGVIELTGPAGTIMGVDTIGLHKGKTPEVADRLALENEFSTSLFGADYERPQFEPTDLVRDRFAQMPWVLQRYGHAL
ncbi:MAG: phytanoyl-CoA dioxygenase family protein [Actinobacteria bacterium]|nr:phytanoyl-CoA dioxygenase family protein [Actinomycetota bacterium]